MTTMTYTVTGMTCGHCVSAVSTEIGKLPGVSDVQVDLPTGAVTVTSAAPLSLAQVADAVDEAGYELAGAGTDTGAGTEDERSG
ncbi:MAG: heavy-metal-associated domain-containing protein [Actinomycetota bacterium]|nr:heavy-metal-associated domain-containing protein [Actinomycetota bacterium]